MAGFRAIVGHCGTVMGLPIIVRANFFAGIGFANRKPDSCTAADIAASFEQCVGTKQEGFWNREAHGLRSSEIEGQLKLRGLLYG
jgi:hypothetical protein